MALQRSPDIFYKYSIPSYFKETPVSHKLFCLRELDDHAEGEGGDESSHEGDSEEVNLVNLG